MDVLLKFVTSDLGFQSTPSVPMMYQPFFVFLGGHRASGHLLGSDPIPYSSEQCLLPALTLPACVILCHQRLQCYQMDFTAHGYGQVELIPPFLKGFRTGRLKSYYGLAKISCE